MRGVGLEAVGKIGDELDDVAKRGVVARLEIVSCGRSKEELVNYTLTSLIRTPQNRAFLSTGHHLLVNFILTSSKSHVANLLTHHISADGR